MSKRVLVIDDDCAILDCMIEILSLEGYSVQGYGSPEHIKKHIRDFQPDLILLDIKMGAYNGLEICKMLKEAPDYKNIPVMIVSSSEDISRAVTEYKADEITAKPFDVSFLVDKVEGLLSPVSV